MPRNHFVREEIHQFAYRDATRRRRITKLQRPLYQPLVGLRMIFQSGVMVLGKNGFFVREVMCHMCEQLVQRCVEFMRIRSPLERSIDQRIGQFE